ncbi:hypothetical protein OG195_27345 [Streptomyces sp. NBC_01362]|uniref:hypothetical protein n=1 Tax=Streptomyces sp. NBC_01362 TaxID=2903839 RepID=UPI002E378691|nr:hypothetical protein [Streptomyces sp. NBC_01362]
MSDRPITPTRIIPAGSPLPERGPEPGEIPPWRTAPAPPAPPAPPVMPPAAPPAAPPPPPVQQIFIPQGPFEVHVTLQPPEPEPTRWERFTAWVGQFGRPWQICGGVALALLPIPGVGYSVATTWASVVSETRDAGGQGTAYALACTPLAWALLRIYYSGGTIRRLTVLAVALVGLTGAFHLYDPVTWVTGVSAS